MGLLSLLFGIDNDTKYIVAKMYTLDRKAADNLERGTILYRQEDSMGQSGWTVNKDSATKLTYNEANKLADELGGVIMDE